MTTFAIVLVLLLGLIVSFLLVGFFLPSSWTIDKAELINTTSEKVLDMIIDLDNWSSWLVWSIPESEYELVYSEDKIGQGAWQSFSNNQMSATIHITGIEPDQKVHWKMDIDKTGFQIQGVFVVATTAVNYTQVACRIESGKVSEVNPAKRIQLRILKQFIDEAFDESLTNLQMNFRSESE